MKRGGNISLYRIYADCFASLYFVLSPNSTDCLWCIFNTKCLPSSSWWGDGYPNKVRVYIAIHLNYIHLHLYERPSGGKLTQQICFVACYYPTWPDFIDLTHCLLHRYLHKCLYNYMCHVFLYFRFTLVQFVFSPLLPCRHHMTI